MKIFEIHSEYFQIMKLFLVLIIFQMKTTVNLSNERITNDFPGGLFPYVRKVSLFDE